MRDAFGGLFMIRLFIIFIFIYVAFAAVSLNYARAFRLKNAVISFIEEKEIIDLNYSTMSGKENSLNKLIKESGYHKTCDSMGYTNGEQKEGTMTTGYCYNGIVINIKSSELIEGTTSRLIKYEVITTADWNMQILKKLLVLGGKKENSQSALAGFWKIKGEAQVVARN